VNSVISADEAGMLHEKPKDKRKVIICTPTISKPFPEYLASLERSVPALDAAGFDHGVVFTVGCPYISHARATMTRKAMDAKADIVVYIDHDVSWNPEDLLRLIMTDGDVVGGTYRFKKDEETYMGTVLTDARGYPVCRGDGCISAQWMPAGFLKVTKEGIDKFMHSYPELIYGPHFNPSVDLFNHGAHDRLWYGEDYAFSRNYTAKCGPIWLVPDLDLTHHSSDKAYPGNFHRHLLRRPGGSESDCPVLPQARAA
jgi:glycosyltransferase involved in cell wall biosynthesis